MATTSSTTVTPSIIIQQQNVALCTLLGGNGKPVPLFITNEWRRPLELMAQIVNSQASTIEDIQARLTAGGL